MKKKGQMIPLPLILLSLVMIVLIGAYLAAPDDKKILVPVTAVVFIFGVLLDQINPLLSVLLGSIYWFVMELFSQWGVSDTVPFNYIFAPVVVVSIVAFLIGRLFGRWGLRLMGLGG